MPDLNQWADRVHDNAVQHGFHDRTLNFPEQIAYCHSELSEALTAHQNGQPAAWLNHPSQHPHMAQELTSHPVNELGQRCLPFQGDLVACPPDGWAVELVDALFRILDLAAAHHIDLEQVAEAKYRWNLTRPHLHGKTY